jgi:threonine dehydratase
VDDLLLVDEGDVEQAIVMLLEVEKTLVEGAGAAGLAALLRHPAQFQGRTRSGWCCVAAISTRCCWRPSSSAAWCARAGWHACAWCTRCAGHAGSASPPRWPGGANVNEVHHQRAFTTLAAQNVWLVIAAACGRVVRAGLVVR